MNYLARAGLVIQALVHDKLLERLRPKSALLRRRCRRSRARLSAFLDDEYLPLVRSSARWHLGGFTTLLSPHQL